MFRADLPAGTYHVIATLGDALWARDQMDIFQTSTGIGAYNIATAAGQFAQRGSDVTVGADRHLNLTIRDTGGDPYWVVNALEIRPDDRGRGRTPSTVPGRDAGGQRRHTDRVQRHGRLTGELVTLHRAGRHDHRGDRRRRQYQGSNRWDRPAVGFSVLRPTPRATCPLITCGGVTGQRRPALPPRATAWATPGGSTSTLAKRRPTGFLGRGQAATRTLRRRGYGWNRAPRVRAGLRHGKTDARCSTGTATTALGAAGADLPLQVTPP